MCIKGFNHRTHVDTLGQYSRAIRGLKSVYVMGMKTERRRDRKEQRESGGARGEGVKENSVYLMQE